MAASSSSSSPVVAPMTSTQHQVFISFRGDDIRTGFLDYLVDEMQVAGINVFIDEHEVRGMDLQNLLVRIPQSEVAVVIFSENYTTSDWCLDELVKIKECANGVTFMAIPVFYKVEASDVHEIEGNFGVNFRALKRKNKFDKERTRKWKEAITSISEKSGMELLERSRMADRSFIKSMIVEVKRSLEHIANNIANRRELPEAIQVQQPETIQVQQPEAIQVQQPETIQVQQPEAIQVQQSEAIQVQQPAAIKIPQPNVSSQGCIFNVRQLKISGSHNARYWTFESVSESPNGEAIEVSKMKKSYYLEVNGKFHTKLLTSGRRYEVVFVVKVEDTMSRWKHPATVQLMVPDKDLQEREFQFVDLIKNEWTDIQAGVFEARPHRKKIGFYLYQHKSNGKMKGLVIKGAIIRPLE